MVLYILNHINDTEQTRYPLDPLTESTLESKASLEHPTTDKLSARSRRGLLVAKFLSKPVVCVLLLQRVYPLFAIFRCWNRTRNVLLSPNNKNTTDQNLFLTDAGSVYSCQKIYL